MDGESEADTNFLLELEKERQEMTRRQKQEFCKYVLECPGRDADCLHPYKTDGCHEYKALENHNL